MNVMRWTIGPVMVALAGCAMTPAELVEHGKTVEMHHSQNTVAVKDCITRNFEMNASEAAVSVVKLPEPQTARLILRTTGFAAATLAVIDISPIGSSGAQSTWRWFPYEPDYNVRRLMDRFNAGC